MCLSDCTSRRRPAGRGLVVAATAALALLTASCLKNDIPYPRIPVVFTSIACEGSLQDASVDSINRTVTFFLDESADLHNVKVTSYTLSPEGATWSEAEAFAAGVDLSSSRQTHLTFYQDWYWSFSAVQEIERHFTIENQIGAATIDVPGRRVVANVPTGTNMSRIRVTSLKLGGPEAVYSPELEGSEVDFTLPVGVDVTEHGRTQHWEIYVVASETNVTINNVDAWTCVAWVYANGIAGQENRLEYRKAGDTEWTPVPDEWVTHNGGAFTGRLIHLAPLTEYEVRAFTGDEGSAATGFMTSATWELPNGNMDSWWLDGKVWCPWPQDGERFWDTGNKGAATLGQSNSYPVTDTPSGHGQAACLETRFVGIASIGKLAAGNLFIGSYVRTDGTNGVLSFGRPFTLHPTRLTGWMKYTSATINYANSEMASHKGEPDQCVIWCALLDSSTPQEIRTNPNNRLLFDPDRDYVIAYGKLQSSLDVKEWTRFDFELEYKSTSRTPTYLLITASASWLGDYFTGGTGSTLWVDDFELGWDY